MTLLSFPGGIHDASHQESTASRLAGDPEAGAGARIVAPAGAEMVVGCQVLRTYAGALHYSVVPTA